MFSTRQNSLGETGKGALKASFDAQKVFSKKSSPPVMFFGTCLDNYKWRDELVAAKSPCAASAPTSVAATPNHSMKLCLCPSPRALFSELGVTGGTEMSLRSSRHTRREDRAESAENVRTRSSSGRKKAKPELEDIKSMLEGHYPPILSLEQAAELAGWAPSTLKRKVSEDQFRHCVSRRRPLRFWRDLFAWAVMQ